MTGKTKIFQITDREYWLDIGFCIVKAGNVIAKAIIDRKIGGA